MSEGAILEALPDSEAAEESQEEQEVPSVFSTTTNHLIGRADVSPPTEDGSRIMRLFSASGGAVVEANLSATICAFLASRLVAVEVIEEVIEDDNQES